MAQFGTRSEAEAFLTEHPDVQWVDMLVIDMSGLIRGKRYPREDAAKAYDAGVAIPRSLYALDVTGDSLDPLGVGFSDGDPDGLAFPLAGRLALRDPGLDAGDVARVLLSMKDADGTPTWLEPRVVLEEIAGAFAARDLHPVVALELEFYLIDRVRGRDGAPRIARNPRSGRRSESGGTYSLSLLDDFATFFTRVKAMAKAQRLPATVATSEFSAGQFEVNLRHVRDALTAADHAALLRGLIGDAARAEGVEATFMSKPFLDRPGSGLHIHISLENAAGDNVFDDGAGGLSETARHAIGGLAAAAPQSMAFFAANQSAYRRYAPNNFVPVTRDWAVNNRSVALRVPLGGASARRIEHRFSGADANPYLVTAMTLAGILYGIQNRVEPPPAAKGNAGFALDPELPTRLDAALARLRAPGPLDEVAPRRYLDLYAAAKQAELDKLRAGISPIEYAWYL